MSDKLEAIGIMEKANSEYSISHFSDLTSIIEDTIDSAIALRGFIPIMMDTTNYVQLVNQILFAKVLQNTLVAYDCSKKGLFSTAWILIRSIFEISLLMRYFNQKPDKAEKWWFDKKWFPGPSDVRNELFKDSEGLSELREGYRGYYGDLSKHLHSCKDGSVIHIFYLHNFQSEPPMTATSFPIFRELSSETDEVSISNLSNLLFVLNQGMASIISTFKDEIATDKKITDILNSTKKRIDKTLIKYAESQGRKSNDQ